MVKSSDALEKVLAAVREGFGDEAALRMSEDGARSEVTEVIPTGVSVLDRYVIGCGGLPVGRLVEVYSPEGVGKTSFCMGACAGAQREGGLAIWAETEEALSRERFTLFGADLDKMILLQPGSIEQVGQQFETALTAIPKGIGPNLLVWDSVAATPTQQEVDGGLVDYENRMGMRAQKLGALVKMLSKKLSEHRACLLAVNQVRDNIGVMFGDKYTTPGGHALKFHASVRLQLFGGKSVKDGDEHTGKAVTFIAAKNKVGMPWRKCSVRLDYSSGWDDVWTTINHAKDKKLLPDATRVSAKAYGEALEKLGWPASGAVLPVEGIEAPVEVKLRREDIFVGEEVS